MQRGNCENLGWMADGWADCSSCSLPIVGFLFTFDVKKVNMTEGVRLPVLYLFYKSLQRRMMIWQDHRQKMI